jgi:MFS family permease
VGTAKTAGETPPVGAPSAAAVEQLSPSFWRVVLVLTAFSLVNFPDALLLLRLHDIGFGLATIIGAYITYNAVYAALSYPAGALSDRWPRARVFGAGLLFFATAYVGLGATRDHAAAWVLLTVYGAFTAFTDGVGKAWISTLVPDGRQGSAQGVFQGAIGAAVLLAGVWAGLAWGGDGQVPLLVSGAIGAVIAAWLVVAPRSVAGRTTRYAGTP